MKKLTIFFYITVFLFVLSSCGRSEDQESDTERLVVGAGITFQSEDGKENLNDSGLMDIQLTAADLEGMSEEIVRTIKNANIYAKPAKTASVIGAVDARTNIGIYGLTEDEAWMVVSFNGRVGYVEADVFERETVETQTVIVPTPQRDNTSTSNTQNGNNQSQNSGNNQSPNGNNQSQNGNNSGGTNDNSQKPSGGTASSGNGDVQPPSSGASGDTESGDTQNPSGGDTDAGDAQEPSDEGTDVPSGGDTDTPSGGDAQEPGDNTQQPDDTQDPNEGEEAPEGTEPPVEEVPEEIPTDPDNPESLEMESLE